MFERVRTNTAAEKGIDQRYFTCGTVGEVTVSSEKGGECTFELFPDEEMKVVRDGRDEHIWLSDTASDDGKVDAMICRNKMAIINFSGHLEFLQLLIAAKINCLHVRAYAIELTREGVVRLCALAIM